MPARPGVTLPRVVRAEWGKAAALPSTRWAVVAAVVVNAGLACFVAYNARYALDAQPPGLLDLLTLGAVATQLPVLAAGVLVSAAEYPSGGARSTFLAVPRRLPVLGAQALAVAALAALTAVAVLGITFLAVLPFGGELVLTLDLSDSGTTRVLGGFVLYLVTSAVLGTALGTLARSPAAGLVTAVGLVFLLERAVTVLGSPRLLAVLPGWAGRLVLESDADAALTAARAGLSLTPWQGYAVLAAWAAALLCVAALQLRRRDL